MPAPHRPRLHRPVLLAAAAVSATVALTSCSAADTAREADTDGPSVGAVEIRDTSIDAELTGATPDDPSSAYGDATLNFTAINTDSAESDTLVSITSPAASSVTLDATAEQLVVEPGTSIAAGQPVENVGGDGSGADRPFTVAMELTDGELQPGTSVTVTFRFERAGDVTVDVPFDVVEPDDLDRSSRPLPPAVEPG